MRNHAEKLHANKDYKLAIAVFVPTLPFSKKKPMVHFSSIICTKTRPCSTLLFI